MKHDSKEDSKNISSGASLVEIVWGIDLKDNKFIRDNFGKDSNPLDKESFETYQSLCNDSSNEEYLYKPFQRLVEALTESARNSLGLGKSPAMCWNQLEQCMTSLLVLRKPDVFLEHEHLGIPTRTTALLKIELRKTGQEADKEGSINQKREHSKDDSGPASKSVSSPFFPNDQFQPARHTLKCMGVPTCHNATGIFIDRFKVSLWHYDCVSMIRAVDFDFRESPELLALVLFAITSRYDSTLRVDPTDLSPFLDQPFPTVTGMHLENVRMKFQINKTSPKECGPIGRGTTGRDFTPGFDDGRSVESRTTNPGRGDHLPDIKFSTTLTSTLEELSPPIVNIIPTRREKLEGRHLHIPAIKKYKRLWEVDNVSDFKAVFVDCLECHHYTHTLGMFPPRNLSENDLRFGQEDGVISGVFNDWDIASTVDNAGEVPISTAGHRTEAVTFMAIDLLLQDSPTHLYRHDLESFFYILVWAAMNYDLKHGKRCPIQRDIACWRYPAASRRNKTSFLLDSDESITILSQARPEFQGVVKEWIMPLLDLFRRGRMSLTDSKMALTQPYDSATYGGHITFDTFMEALGRTPRHRPDEQTTP